MKAPINQCWSCVQCHSFTWSSQKSGFLWYIHGHAWHHWHCVSNLTEKTLAPGCCSKKRNSVHCSDSIDLLVTITCTRWRFTKWFRRSAHWNSLPKAWRRAVYEVEGRYIENTSREICTWTKFLAVDEVGRSKRSGLTRFDCCRDTAYFPHGSSTALANFDHTQQHFWKSAITKYFSSCLSCLDGITGQHQNQK